MTLDEIRIEKQQLFSGTYQSSLSRVKKVFCKPQSFYIAGSIIYTCLSIIIIVLITSPHSHSSSTDNGSYHEAPALTAHPSANTTDPFCGSTPAEALALGCTFDLYTLGWVPHHCYNPSVSADSESATSELAPLGAGPDSYTFYWDKARTRPASRADLELAGLVNGERGEQVIFWSKLDYHRAHCLHVWRLQGSSLERMTKGEKGMALTMEGVELAHVRHCSKLMLDRETSGDKLLKVNPGVRRCALLN